jgi:hypothetical protein
MLSEDVVLLVQQQQPQMETAQSTQCVKSCPETRVV